MNIASRKQRLLSHLNDTIDLTSIELETLVYTDESVERIREAEGLLERARVLLNATIVAR